MDIEF